MDEVSFGEWLRRRRKAQGLTQEQLAQQISCSTSALRKIEAEERRPSEQIVEKLADLFQVPASERVSFLKFARGYWGAAPTGAMETAPWRSSSSPDYEDPLNSRLYLATFLFTDIEGSSKLWEIAPEQMKLALQRHHAILNEVISANGGKVFQIVGDAFCAVFRTAPTAISAAATAQRELYQEVWDLPFPIRVRMGIHTGEAELLSTDSPSGIYASNRTMNRVARILKAGHGGQVLLSLVTKELVGDLLPAHTDLADMGEHQLKDLVRPEHLYQLNIEGLPADFPPLVTLDLARHNLPVQLTSFIGREKEQTEILKLISEYRLVTLIGSGGVGKTRLSLKVGEAVLGDYADGVWLVELAPVSDPLLIPRTIAIAIGLRDEPHRPVIDMLLLCDYLQHKKLLLILDNCEHLVEACAQLVDWLLHACPQIRILASSREALGMWGEKLYLVPSLQLPDMQNLSTVESISQYEAVRLFIERASAATQHFTVTNENVFSIVQICRRLDGIPLAIELAAGKIRSLSAQQIAQRLHDRFGLLTGGSRTALPRHQTLQSAIEWSYDLLSPSEQTLFRRLSVFVNSWTLEAAESICSDKDSTAKDTLKTKDILELLTQLVNKSLVIAEEGHREVRYHMLETIRQFGSAKLQEANESESMRDQHLEHFLELAETAEPHLRRAEQIEWLKRLDAEHENLRTALVWTMGKPSAEPALRLAGALGVFWDMRAYWLEGARWLVQALNKEWDTSSKLEKAARAKALLRRAAFASALDEMEVMKTSVESALMLSKEVEDTRGMAYARALLAEHLSRTENFKASKPLLEQSLNEFHLQADEWGKAWVFGCLSRILMKVGTQDEYVEMMQQAISCARLSGDRDLIARLLVEQASNVFSERKWDQAEKMLEEADQLFTEIASSQGINAVRFLRAQLLFRSGNHEEAKAEAKLCFEYFLQAGEKSNQGQSLFLLALIAEFENDLQSAVEHLQKSVDLFREIGTPQSIGLTLVLGRLKYQQGELQIAKQFVRDSLQLLREKDVRATWWMDYVFCQIGVLLIDREPQLTVQYLALAETLFKARPVSSWDAFEEPFLERFLSAARAKLSEAEFASAWQMGMQMIVEEALDLALKLVDDM